MTREPSKNDAAEKAIINGVKRRKLLSFGLIAATVTGASTFSTLTASRSEAAVGPIRETVTATIAPAQTELTAAFAGRCRLPDDPNFRQIPVVMMHSMGSLLDALGTLKDYKAWGYETIFYSELMEYLSTGDASNLPEKPLVITDDDGGLSAYQYLFPALKELGMKATYFIVPDWVGGKITSPPNGGAFMEPKAFTWTNAVEMQASGLVEFQSHTKTHGSMRTLTGAGTFSAGLIEDGTGAGADFLATKALIEANVPGANVQYSAAPYGVINEAAIASLKAAGCKGNRITQCGRGADHVYDGSGPMAFTLPSTDPFRVPIASDGSFKNIRRANVYGEADADGNRFQNGLFLVDGRGLTNPPGWSYVKVPLPTGGSAAAGRVLRGYGTGAATGAYHTDLIPVEYFGQFSLDFYVKATSTLPKAARVVLDCYDSRTGPLVKTIVPSQGQSNDTLGGWQRRRINTLGDDTYQYVRPRFEILNATATSEMLIWDVRLRVQRNALGSGSPRGI